MWPCSRRSRAGAVAPPLLVIVLTCGLLTLQAAPSVPAVRTDSGGWTASAGPTPLDCNGGTIQIGHLSVTAGAGCGEGFEVTWAQNFSQWSSTTSYNFSYSIVAIAELTPTGIIDELSPLLWAPNGSTDVTRSLQEVNFTVNLTAPVAPATGPWIPGITLGAESTWAPWSGSWVPGNATTGNVSVQTIFHLFTNFSAANSSSNATGGGPANTSYSLKFDLAVHDWPWVNSSDHLGLILDAISLDGAHFVFNGSAGNLTQQWNATGQPVVSLLFGPQARAVESNGTTTPVAVSSEAYLRPNASTPRNLYGNISYGFDAYVLVNFSRGAGGYPSLTYDPWIVFHIAPPSSPGSPGGTFGPFGLSVIAWAAILGAIGIAGLAVAIRFDWARKRQRGTELARRLSETDWTSDDEGRPVIWRPP